jgi:capsular exopolysaccharide synthesis family protein
MRPGPRRSLLTDLSTDAPHVTEVRRLLQSLFRHQREGEGSVYMVTSAARGEGKSTICALLGIVAARIFRRRTLLLDGDMRRPTLHSLLDVSQRPGLFDLLKGTAPLAQVIRATLLPTLSVIPAGRPGAQVTDAYDDLRFARLLQEVRASFDLIFVDAAPVVPVVEPIMMAEHVDGLFIVAMAGRTPLSHIRRMRDILEPVSSKVAGVIVNNATEGLPYYYDYRYYGYETPRPSRIRTPSAPSTGEGTEPKSAGPERRR